MEIKLNEQQYKRLIDGLIKEFRHTRDFYLIAKSSSKINLSDLLERYDKFHTELVEYIMDIAEGQNPTEDLIPLYNSIGLITSFEGSTND